MRPGGADTSVWPVADPVARDGSVVGIPRLVIAPDVAAADLESRWDGEVWLDAQGQVFARCQVRGSECSIRLPGVGTFRFERDGGTVVAVPDPSVATETLRRTYRDHVLPLVLQACGTEVLHASAVRGPHGVAVFCGGTGTGKSSVAFGLARRGHSLWADDAVALEFSDAAVHAVPLPFETRLRPSAATFFGAPPAAGVAGARQGDGADMGTARARIASVCVLTRASVPGAVAIRRLRGSAALAAVLPHAQCFQLDDPDPKRRMIGRYLDLTARVPVLAVDFEPAFDVFSLVLDEVERTVLGAPDADA
jgi:hypothetical protein